MGNSVLRGISAALLVTVITLLAGMFWSAMGYGGLSASSFVDIGLIASCITAGYRTGKESGQWFLGGVAALGYAALSILLVALFLPVSRWGAVQILAEGGLIGVLAGGFGAGKTIGGRSQGMSWNRPGRGRSFSWSEDHQDEDWDSHKERNEKEWSTRSRDNWESDLHDEASSSEESEWEEWMSRDSSMKATKEGRRETTKGTPKAVNRFDLRSEASDEYEMYGSNREQGMNTNRAWWEEDAGFHKVL